MSLIAIPTMLCKRSSRGSAAVAQSYTILYYHPSVTYSIYLMFQTDKYELIKPAFYSKLTETFVLN